MDPSLNDLVTWCSAHPASCLILTDILSFSPSVFLVVFSMVLQVIFIFLKEDISAHCNICLLLSNHHSFPVFNLASLVLPWKSLSLHFAVNASSHFQEEPTNSVCLNSPAILMLCHLLIWNITLTFPSFLVPIEPFYSFFVLLFLLFTDTYLSMNVGNRQSFVYICILLTIYAFMCSIASSWQSYEVDEKGYIPLL